MTQLKKLALVTHILITILFIILFSENAFGFDWLKEVNGSYGTSSSVSSLKPSGEEAVVVKPITAYRGKNPRGEWRKPRIKDLPPVEMVGTWKYIPTNGEFDIDTSGNWYTIQPPLPYTFENGGAKLDWSGWVFNRTGGELSSVIGIWESDDEYKEEFHYRADGTYVYHDPFGTIVDLFGTYQANASSLGIKEIRGIISINGTELVFDGIYNPTYFYQWTIVGNLMTWTPNGGGTPLQFEKVN